MPQTIPLSVAEVERMRILLHKAKVLNEQLTPSEESELRRLISKDKPKEASNSDLNALIAIGLFLLGVYIAILIVESRTPQGISA